jgi:hypothetical protein
MQACPLNQNKTSPSNKSKSPKTRKTLKLIKFSVTFRAFRAYVIASNRAANTLLAQFLVAL